MTYLSHQIPRTLAAGLAALAMAGCAELDAIDGRLAANEAALARCERNQQGLIEAAGRHESALAALDSRLAQLADSCVAARPSPDNALAVETSSPDPTKLVVGARERVWVEDLQLALPARVDTGAETASLDARNITAFERDGRPWVRFVIPHPDGGDPLALERPLVREALVVQASSAAPERRPVIELGIQIGPVRQLAEFTLSDRSHLDFQMLVGRNILRDVMLVDVSESHLVPPPKGDTRRAADGSPDASR